jgi:hypothetical protein
MTDPNKGWKALSFRDNEDVPAHTPEARAAHIRSRAMEKFGLSEGDINMEFVPAYPGTMSLRNIETGGVETLHVFEMQIAPAAAARLNVVHYPDVLYAGDIIETPKPVYGARDPRSLPKGPKIRW